MKKEVPDITPKSKTQNKSNTKKTKSKKTNPQIPNIKPKKINNKTNKQKTTKTQIKYNQPEKFRLSDLTKAFPKELIPTSRYNEIFGFVFLAGILISIFFLDFGAFFNATEELAIEVGFPFKFFSINTAVDDTSLPIKWGGLLLDILIYLIVAYVIEVVFNVASAIHPKSKGEKAKVYKVPQKINQKK